MGLALLHSAARRGSSEPDDSKTLPVGKKTLLDVDMARSTR